MDDIKIIEPNLEEKEDDTQPTIKDKEPLYSVNMIQRRKQRRKKWQDRK